MSSICSSRSLIRFACSAVAEAPFTAAAVLALADRRYFDGSTWHRVVPNFVVQDGDPRGDGWGGPAFVLRDGINPVRYESGTVGMALSGPDTGGCQYFITLTPQPHFDGTYVVFGRMVAGRDVLDRISQGSTSGAFTAEHSRQV
jgi:cyclophilin family peptidyl-prolyl cis-trans isomerase